MCPNSSLHLVYSHIFQIFIILNYPIQKEWKSGKERERVKGEMEEGKKEWEKGRRKEKRKKCIIYFNLKCVLLLVIYLSIIYNSSVGKESTWNAEDPSSIPVLGRTPGEGIGYPLQYSGLENSTDYIVLGVAKSQ